MYSCRLEALLEINEEATQNFSQSCGKWWWTRTGPIHGLAAPPNNPNHTILLGTIVWMVVLAKYESNVMSDLDDRPTGGLNENQCPEGAYTGHTSQHSQKRESPCIGELRQLC